MKTAERNSFVVAPLVAALIESNNGWGQSIDTATAHPDPIKGPLPRVDEAGGQEKTAQNGPKRLGKEGTWAISPRITDMNLRGTDPHFALLDRCPPSSPGTKRPKTAQNGPEYKKNSLVHPSHTRLSPRRPVINLPAINAGCPQSHRVREDYGYDRGGAPHPG